MMRIGGIGVGLMGFGWLVMIAIAVLVILGIIALVRYLRSSGNTHRAGYPGTNPGAAVNPALQILNERYARGEISDEEYRAKKAEITK